MRSRAWSMWAVGLTVMCLSGTAAADLFSRGNGLVNDSAHALDRKKWREGAALAREALESGELMPSNVAAAYNNLCVGLIGLGRLDDAMEACTRAIDLKPRQWISYNNRANIYFHHGDYDRALAEYYKALTFSPGDDVLLGNIALTIKTRQSKAPPLPRRT